MTLTRRALLTALPLLPLVLRLRPAESAVRWYPSAHMLNHPARCQGWWIANPMSGGRRWVDLVHERVGVLSGMALPATTSSGYRLRTQRRGGTGEVNFDGSDDVVTAPAILSDPTRLSLSCWLNYTSSLRGIITKGAAYDGPNPGWYLRVHTAEQSVGFWFQQDDANYTGLVGTLIVADGAWHHVAVTVPDRTNPALWTLTIDTMVDGGAAPFAAGTVTSVSTSEPLRFGNFGGGANPYTGALDDIRLYAGYVLSRQDIVILATEPLHGYATLLAGPRPVAPGLLAGAPIPLYRRGLLLGGH